MSTVELDVERRTSETAEPDDIDAYIETFDADERQRLSAAEAAIDVAILLHRARQRRGLSQSAAARLAGLHQQAVSRFEKPDVNPQLDTIQSYLGALGYAIEVQAIDLKTGELAAKAVLPPPPMKRNHRVSPAERRRPSARSRRRSPEAAIA